MDIRITQKSTGATIGRITPEDFQFLVDQLEEESSKDADYFINAHTILMLESNGGSPGLISMLRAAVGASEGIEIAWQE